MKIIIAGAGDIGFHLASNLSSQKHDIVLIDTNEEVLEYVSSHLDVLVVKGDASSLDILKVSEVTNADLFLGVTTSENTNIVACILAKHLGVKRTIARVSKRDLISLEQKQILKNLGIDKLIYPVDLATKEIERILSLGSVIENFEFEEGKISLLGVSITADSPLVNKTLRAVNQEFPHVEARPVAILRRTQTILPRSEEKFLLDDHAYFITRKKDVEALLKIVGRPSKNIKKVMILGGTELSMNAAMHLEKKYDLTVVASDKNFCKKLTEVLNNSLIVKGETSQMELLKEEGMTNMDAFIALTPNSETNIIASLMAEQEGVQKTMALVNNADYTQISHYIGVDTIINKKLIAASNIYRFVRRGNIEAITSLNGVDAEIIEYHIKDDNPLIDRPIKEIKFPADSIIGGVVRGDDSFIPDGHFILKANDKVIVFALLDSIPALEKLFFKG